jgi:hypothetical protein
MDKCFECKFACITGGDNVPYGSGYARLPEYLEECNAPETKQTMRNLLKRIIAIAYIIKVTEPNKMLSLS